MGLGGKGSSQSQTTTKNIPDQTSQEADAEKRYINYANTAANAGDNSLGTYQSTIENTVNPDYSSLLNTYNNTMSGINSSASSLANGELPSSYATNRENALNSELQGTVGSMISNLGSRGILNSSVTNNALNNISQNASNTLAADYTSDLSNASSLLNSQASLATQPLSTAYSTQQASYYQPETSLSNAATLYSPNTSLFDTLYNGRMGSAGSTTTTSSDGGGGLFGSALGAIAGGYGAALGKKWSS